MIVEYSDNEFIKLNRKIANWEWYLNVNVKVLFIHCLLKANWKDGKFEGKEVKRGSFVTSLDKLSKETGLSVRQVRTALNHLFLTGELTSISCSKYRVITVTNYNQYQLCDKQVDNQVTSKRQASDKQATTIEEYIRSKELKEDKKDLSNDKSDISIVSHHKKIVDKWNTLSDLGIKTLRSITPGSKREKNLKARLKEFGEDSFDEVVDHIQHSKYLQGKVNGWIVDFDWAVLPSNYQKILDGKYDDREEKKTAEFNMDDFMKRFSDGN